MTKPRYLLDTNISIYIRRQQPPHIRTRFEQLATGEAAISVITFGELVYGAEKSSGETIGNDDLWIAAHAVTADLTLVSNNTREFARVERLRLENWAIQ